MSIPNRSVADPSSHKTNSLHFGCFRCFGNRSSPGTQCRNYSHAKNSIGKYLDPVTASLDYDTVDLSGGIPARTISVIVEGRGKTVSTGHISIPDTKSSGNVIFTNLTDAEIIIPSGDDSQHIWRKRFKIYYIGSM